VTQNHCHLYFTSLQCALQTRDKSCLPGGCTGCSASSRVPSYQGTGTGGRVWMLCRLCRHQISSWRTACTSVHRNRDRAGGSVQEAVMLTVLEAPLMLSSIHSERPAVPVPVPTTTNPSLWRNYPHSHVKHEMLNLTVQCLGSLAQPREHSRPEGRHQDASSRLRPVCECQGMQKQRPSDPTHTCHTGKEMPSRLLSRAQGWSQISSRDGIASPPNMVCL